MSFSTRIVYTQDILSLPSRFSALIVPCNRFLIGCRFPYVTRGATIPFANVTSIWGPAGSNMSGRWGGHEIDVTHQLYPIHSLDGLVHRAAGPSLARHINSLPFVDGLKPVKLLPGQALSSPSFDLTDRFAALIHTPTPYREDLLALHTVADCYVRSMAEVLRLDLDSAPRTWQVVTALLGNGTRAFSIEESCQAAVEACTRLKNGEVEGSHPVELTFALRDAAAVDALSRLLISKGISYKK
ncbi:hypothetical protein BC830DRAFT_1081451 [Chytriomyces sp. MP71]|nr:hypothetical protein BC830DRAFT_1081451 [Chytriomyces sp. MP71]